MNYRQHIDINLNRDRVIELFNSTENLKKWQPGLISFEHISGEPGEVGAKSQIVYQMGKRECAMVETIISNGFPEEFIAEYHSKGVHNKVINQFEIVDENTTRWVSHNEFNFESLMMKLMGWLMPGMFKKESFKFMQYFKDFAEQNQEPTK